MLSFSLQLKPDLNTTLPVRQTASIFKQPVTKVTNHPNNKVKTDPQKAVDQPKQVSLRAVNVHISDICIHFTKNNYFSLENIVFNN